jgi:hypothetical protein
MVTVAGQSPSPDAPVACRCWSGSPTPARTPATPSPRVATGWAGADLLTVVGPLLGAQAGESLRLTGRWSSHPQYGRQFQMHTYATVLPATIQGIRAAVQRSKR